MPPFSSSPAPALPPGGDGGGGPVSLVVSTRDVAKVIRACGLLESSSLMLLCPGSVVLVHACMPDSADPTLPEGFGALTYLLTSIGVAEEA